MNRGLLNGVSQFGSVYPSVQPPVASTARLKYRGGTMMHYGTPLVQIASSTGTNFANLGGSIGHMWLGMTWLDPSMAPSQFSMYFASNGSTTGTIMYIVIYECDEAGLPGRLIADRPFPMGTTASTGLKTSNVAPVIVPTPAWYWAGLFYNQAGSCQTGAGRPVYGPTYIETGTTTMGPTGLGVSNIPAGVTPPQSLCELPLNTGTGSYGMYAVPTGIPGIIMRTA